MYRNVHARFWSDPKIRKLTPDERYLFLYLVTNEHSHVAGIYRLPKLYIQEETGLSRKAIDSAFESFSSQNLAHYDQATEQVWIVKMLCYQGHGSKIQAAIARHLKELHTSELKSVFAKTYSYPIDTLSTNDRYPIDRLTVPVPVTDTVSDKEVKEGDSKGKPSETKAQSFSEPFQKNKQTEDWLQSERFNPQFISKIDPLFMDWARGTPQKYKDWNAAYRNFVRRKADELGTNGNGIKPIDTAQKEQDAKAEIEKSKQETLDMYAKEKGMTKDEYLKYLEKARR